MISIVNGRALTRLRGRTSLSVLLAALVIGISIAAVVWGAEQAIEGRERAHGRTEMRATLQEARHLLTLRATNSGRAASQLASSQAVQNAFVTHRAEELQSIAAARPDVGFVLWNGTKVGRHAVPGVDVTVGVYGGGAFLGSVVVSASPTTRLLEEARQAHPSVALWFAVGSDVRATAPPTHQPDLAHESSGHSNDELPLAGDGANVVRVVAFRATPHIALGWLWALLAGLLAAGISLGMFRRAEERRRAEPPPNTVRDAVALVGETLAATHNPDALLPVILQAAIEATDASGGSISSGEIVLASRGASAPPAGDPLAFPLRVADGRAAELVLYPPVGGFTADARDAAAWIAAQALIALENAHLHGLVQRQAVTDELTGLANRRRFLAQLDTEVARSRRSGSPLAIVLSDLDDFKQVNDRYGHEAGDKSLVAFADILRAAVRDVDLPVRLGGEEFAVLLPDTDLAGGANLAERIRSALAAAEIESGTDRIHVTASFGVSCFPLAVAAEELLVDADRRLYDAKRRGKNRVEVSSTADEPTSHR
jgi:diguanylate cyclase (GGDEF)-like protein